MIYTLDWQQEATFSLTTTLKRGRNVIKNSREKYISVPMPIVEAAPFSEIGFCYRLPNVTVHHFCLIQQIPTAPKI
jgi:hypothetical protein